MKPMLLEPGEGSVPHRIYDLSISDLQERRCKSMLMQSATDAMSYLGVSSSTFYANRHPGKRIVSKKLKGEYAVRVEKESN